MWNNLYLLHYNNYYNRTIKREGTLSEYLPYLVNSGAVDKNGNSPILLKVNFNPNDNINTQQLVNWGGVMPDYIIVTNESGTDIISRWFVIDEQRQRDGQYNLTLHRDLIADYYNSVVTADTFIEKATVPPSNNLIFNKENLTFNQIKQSETLIKDATGCPWICIYAARDNTEGTTTFNGNTSLGIPVSRYFISQSAFEKWDLTILSNSQRAVIGDVTITDATFFGRYNGKYYKYFMLPETGGSWRSDVTSDYPKYDAVQKDGFVPMLKLFESSEVFDAFSPYFGNMRKSITNIESSASDIAAYKEILQYQNQYARVTVDQTNYQYYKIESTVNKNSVDYKLLPGFIPANGDFYYGALKEPLIKLTGLQQTTKSCLELAYKTLNAKVKVVNSTSQTAGGMNFSITAQRYHLSDAPYDLFCMPYSDTLLIKNSKDATFTEVVSNKEANLQIALRLAIDYAGANQIYDIQLLPFCPLRTYGEVDTPGIFDLMLEKADANYAVSPIVKSGTSTVLGYIFHAVQSSWNDSIELEDPIIIKDYKIESQTDIYRLCSPNYNGVFEFNAAENGGVQYINISCTYKPFTPYIKAYPNWGRLYGNNNFNDARGLICGGDFSLPILTSAWATYELQNKNYQNSFDRQIQNLQVQQDIQRKQEIVGVIGGAIGAGASGATTGAYVGGPLGAIGGTIAGTAASAAAGIIDINLSDKLRAEALDYTRDQFGYSLGNIRALPQSLSKVTAFNIDNRYFPFLEYYTCSNEEKEALKNKIKYNGMTVMVIDKIENYLQEDPTYIKGKLIRIGTKIDEGENFSVVNAIAAELDKGVFI